MPRMLAMERVNWLEALQSQYGTSRNEVTLGAAATAANAAGAACVLTFAGDGVWNIGANLTTAPLIMIPKGVTVNIATGVTWTCNGVIWAQDKNWKTGAGTVTKSTTPGMEVSVLSSSLVTVNNENIGLIVQGTVATDAKVKLFADQGGAQAGISISRSDSVNASTWQFLVNNGGSLLTVRPGSSSMLHLSNTGLGIGSGQVPGALLQLSADSAVKPGTTSWQNPSDLQIKDVLGDFTLSTAFLRTLPLPKRYRYNGKAFTPTDGKEYVTFIAQELQPVAPEWVGSYETLLEPDDTDLTTVLTVDLGTLQFVLVNALKDLDARLTALETP